MTKEAARTAANLILVAAGVAAAYVVFTTPPLRRLASIATRRWLGASIPVFLVTEVCRAWAEQGERRAPPAGVTTPTPAVGVESTHHTLT